MRPDEYSGYWKAIMETMADGLMVVDTSGLIIDVNPAMEMLTGYDRGELVGKECGILECDSCANVRSQGGNRFCSLFRLGQVRGWRCTLRAKSGRRIHVMKNARVLKNEDGQVVGGVETITDLQEVESRDKVIRNLKKKLSEKEGFQGMIGSSPAMKRVYELIESAARSQVPVIITGESGTGKELAARAIHRLGPRKKGPFMAVNCAALNEQLLESELFGHVKGAFTGAERNRTGRFEAAAGGDLFLDEIGDMPAVVQVKLLRVLQEREIERVGDHRPIPIDVRLIAATNRNLLSLIEAGRFRQDLYYRIGVFPIRLPALRERPEDIPLLTEHLTDLLALRTDKAITGVGRPALSLLMAHSWPGNVRELINALEFAFVVCPKGEIEVEHLPDLGSASRPEAPEPRRTRGGAPESDDPDYLRRVLARTGGNKAEAARILGISRTTLWSRLKKFGVRADPDAECCIPDQKGLES